MSRSIVIAGTDTGVGKTIFAAALAGALGASYWKPVQAGLDGETDSDVVRRLSGLPSGRILPEAYRLRTPASPHLAAERDGVVIDAARLAIPTSASSPPGEEPAASPALVVELAGGLLVPITLDLLQIELVVRWAAPVVLCASTRLGTINHTLLSLEALRARRIPTLGVAFIGDPAPDSEAVIPAVSGVRRLGRLSVVDPLGAGSLQAAFRAGFRLQDFRP